MSEKLNNDSDAELERELEELLNENTDNSATFTAPNPEIEKLEQRLNNLHTNGKYNKKLIIYIYYYIYYYISYKIIWNAYNVQI